MKINWKIRFQNKVFLTSLISLIVTFVYQLLALFDVYPPITQSSIIQMCNLVLMMLASLGIIVDPTTTGINDSNRAMQYEWPWDDEADTDCITPKVSNG